MSKIAQIAVIAGTAIALVEQENENIRAHAALQKARIKAGRDPNDHDATGGTPELAAAHAAWLASTMRVQSTKTTLETHVRSYRQADSEPAVAEAP